MYLGHSSEKITEKYGADYYENRFYKTKDEAQDAHEAIRPTYIDLTPEKIKKSLEENTILKSRYENYLEMYKELKEKRRY